jgi:hypothetical protein
MDLNKRNQTIIDAVLARAQTVCPGSLELLGVCGSAATGDTHEKSDLDLLLVVGNGDAGKLAEGFILDDTGVGYDLYCTSWERLEEDAQCTNARRLAKLFDSKIVFSKDGETLNRLTDLREQAAAVLSSDARFDSALTAFGEAEKAFAEACFTDSLSEVRLCALRVAGGLMDALMLCHGQYFKRGIKRTFEELAALGLPFDVEAAVLNVIRANTPESVRAALKELFSSVKTVLRPENKREAPSAENVSGTYEEMVSNWKNKMAEAAERGDCFSSFANLASLQDMIAEIAENVEIDAAEIMDRFDPDDLAHNKDVFDETLREYLKVYEKAGIRPKHYADADAFAADYRLGK